VYIKLIFSAFFFIATFSTEAQSTDSLAIISQMVDDSLKIKALNKLAESMHNKGDLEASLTISGNANELAEKLGDLRGQFNATKRMSSIYYSNTQFAKSHDAILRMLNLADALKDKYCVAESKLALAGWFDYMGYKLKSILKYQEVIHLTEELRNSSLIYKARQGIGSVYMDIGSYQLAEVNYLQALRVLESESTPGMTTLVRIMRMNIYIGELKQKQAKNSDAIWYFRRAISMLDTHPDMPWREFFNGVARAQMGRAYYNLGQWHNANENYLKAIQLLKGRQSADSYYYFSLVGIGEILFDEKKYNEAIPPLLSAIKYYEVTNAFSPHLLRAYQKLSLSYESIGSLPLANSILTKISIAKDSINTREQKEQLNELIIQYQVKENAESVAALRKKSLTSTLVAGVLICLFILCISVVILVVSRRRLKHKNEIGNLEMAALRSQMNPHFIFNCLNSINLFISKSQTTEAFRHLTKFARLMRLILDNSTTPLVSLDAEVDAIRLYLELEAMRFNNRFSYEIKLNGIQVENIRIAPMIIQPLLEGIVWDGIKYGGLEKSNVSLSFYFHMNLLTCIIETNGVDSNKQTNQNEVIDIDEIKSRLKGLQITRDRLRLLSRKGVIASVNVITPTNPGKNISNHKIEINLPVS
jgi:tetratricopeptide (TPR) repeat protein